MSDCLHLEVTDYFFHDKRDMRKSAEPLINIYFKYTDEKSNIFEVFIKSIDSFQLSNKEYLLVNIIFIINNYEYSNKERKVQIIKKDTNTLNLYYLVYLNIEVELTKIINNNEILKKMNKYYTELITLMYNDSIKRNEKNFYQGVIIYKNKKFAYLLFDKEYIYSIFVKKTIDFKDKIYQLDLKNKIFLLTCKDENVILYLKNNPLNNLLMNKLKEYKELKEDKLTVEIMNSFISEVLYFLEDYKKEDKLNQYVSLLENIIEKIK